MKAVYFNFCENQRYRSFRPYEIFTCKIIENIRTSRRLLYNLEELLTVFHALIGIKPLKVAFSYYSFVWYIV